MRALLARKYSNIFSITAGAPWECISIISVPVNECGAAKYIAITWSIKSPELSRIFAKYAWRASADLRFVIFKNRSRKSSPDTRITATPDFPCPDDRAKIMSLLFILFIPTDFF